MMKGELIAGLVSENENLKIQIATLSFIYFNSKGTMVFQFNSLSEKSFRMMSYALVVVKIVISMVEEAGFGEIPEKF